MFNIWIVFESVSMLVVGGVGGVVGFRFPSPVDSDFNSSINNGTIKVEKVQKHSWKSHMNPGLYGYMSLYWLVIKLVSFVLHLRKHVWKGNLVTIIFAFKVVLNASHNVLVWPGVNDQNRYKRDYFRPFLCRRHTIYGAKIVYIRLVPAQDVLFALILWYVAKTLFRS